MRQKSLFIVFYMSIALLFMQWSGLHLHIGADEHANTLHVAHVHGVDLDDHGHDHEADIDVSLFELSTNWFKQIQYFLLLTVALVIGVTVSFVVWSPPFINPIYHSRSYWRPILRGPPTLR